MAYKGHRSGSPRAQLHESFDKHGEDDTLKLAATLGIAEKRIRRWMKKWEYKPGQYTKQRVRWKYDDDLIGVIAVKGEEVSEVHWDNGTSGFIPNRALIEF